MSQESWKSTFIRFFSSTFAALCVILAIQLFVTGSAFAGDRKHATSTICQGMSKEGRDALRYNGSSLEAVGKDVTVMCPIIRDNTTGRMRYVSVRFLRKTGDYTAVRGTVLSCNAAYGGCVSKSSDSSSTNTFTSTYIDTRNMPHTKNHYFSYKTVLPEGWKIVSVMWDED